MNGLQPLFNIASIVVIVKKSSWIGHKPLVKVRHVIPIKCGSQHRTNVPLTTSRVRTTFMSFLRSKETI